MINWPASSPVLNLVENILSYFGKVIYAKNKQFNNKNNLWDIILKAILEISRSYIEALYNSMPKRLCEILKMQKRKRTINKFLIKK